MASTRLARAVIALIEKARVVYSQYVVDHSITETANSEQLTAMVRAGLAHQLGQYILDDKLLDDANCLQMHEDMYRDATVFRTRLCMLSVKELSEMLQAAYDAGKRDELCPEYYPS